MSSGCADAPRGELWIRDRDLEYIGALFRTAGKGWSRLYGLEGGGGTRCVGTNVGCGEVPDDSIVAFGCCAAILEAVMGRGIIEDEALIEYEPANREARSFRPVPAGILELERFAK